VANPLENDCEKITHIHMVVYTWWCWHIYEGNEVGVDVDQLGDGMVARRVRNSTGGVSSLNNNKSTSTRQQCKWISSLNVSSGI